MMLPPQRLCWHTLVAVVLFGSGVIAPVALLFGDEFAGIDANIGVALLVVGSAALLGAALSRGMGRRVAGTDRRWRVIVATSWLLNPVLLIVICTRVWRQHIAGVVWWSAAPLTVALSLQSCRSSLFHGAPYEPWQWHPIMWFVERLLFIAIPIWLFTLQVALYLPTGDITLQSFEIGVCVCGGCLLMSLKFCTMIACLQERNVVVMMLAIMLSADFLCFLHIIKIIGDEVKTQLLLIHLLAAGSLQLYTGLYRMRLLKRWRRVGWQQRVRDTNTTTDVELGAQINTAHHSSSDSDDEMGPGSLQDGFHEALLGVLGVPLGSSQQAHRQFLCGSRRALVAGSQAEPAAASSDDVALPEIRSASSSVAGPGSEGTAAVESQPELAVADKICSICQDEICNGQQVRPMPKCQHIFHAQCLEQWTRQKREETPCPVCRRPALMRKQGEDGTPMSSVIASESASTAGTEINGTQSSSFSRGGSDARPVPARSPSGRSAGGSRGPLPPRTRTAGSQARAARRGNAAAQLRNSLQISETLALVAFECTDGTPEVTAHVLLAHTEVITNAFGAGGSDANAPADAPPGLAEAFLEANPYLADVEVPLRRQLGQLCRAGQLRPTPWSELSQAGRIEVFRVVIEDVQRRLEART